MEATTRGRESHGRCSIKRDIQSLIISRRRFCLCCIAATTFSAAGHWLNPSEALAKARGIVDMIKDFAAKSPIITHKLRRNVSVLEGSGGNIGVLTGPDGKLLVDCDNAVSRPRITKALRDLSADPVTHLINTHWHFNHTDDNEWVHSIGARILAQENTGSICPRHSGLKTGL